MEKLKNYPSLKRGMCVFAVSVGMLSFAFVDDLFLVSKNLDIFASVYKEINLSYVDEVNTSKLMKTGIDAMLNELSMYILAALLPAFTTVFLTGINGCAKANTKKKTVNKRISRMSMCLSLDLL